MSRPPRVIPWEKMTVQQKQDHLFHAHGWPARVSLDFWHEMDHDRDAHGTWKAHIHDKETP